MYYEDYEEIINEIKEKNYQLLALFQEQLLLANLTPKTINRHLSNVNFYLNDFLLYDEPTPMEEGIYLIGEFLGNFFIRKCMWSTPASIKSTAASIKKFYKCMADCNLIEQEEYNALCNTIRNDMEDWQMRCYIYNHPSEF